MSRTDPISSPSHACDRQHQFYSRDQRVTSFFEFWPTWIMYLPVVVLWLILAIRYRSLTLPLIANPQITLSGMVGCSKAEILSQAQGTCATTILPWFLATKTEASPEQQAHLIIETARAKGFSLPFVCKPDTGCRGAGVKLIRDEQSLAQIIGCYPLAAGMIIQQLASHDAEVGIFYVREPGQDFGKIASLTFKERPVVVGDGISTLNELVARDSRASRVPHLYKKRNQGHWDKTIPEGQIHSLLFSASHCRGAVFRDGRVHITPALTAAVDQLMRGLPDFHYGRLDVKYADLNRLEAGESLEVVEINGASSEAIHIWDKDTRFVDAIRTLLWQYRTLFRIGHAIRRRGIVTPSVGQLVQAWRREKRLTAYYPETD